MLGIKLRMFVLLLFSVLILSGCTNDYYVTFVDVEGNALHQAVIRQGDDAIPPSAPRIEGYTFTGWSQSPKNIQRDLVIQAQYERITYTVRFIDFDGELITQMTVAHGDDAVAPSSPQRVGHLFTEWSVGFTEVTQNIETTARYERLIYTVNFYDPDGFLFSSQSVPHGDSASMPFEPSMIGFDFTGWSEPFQVVTSDLDIFPQFEIQMFEVSFYNADGSLLQTYHLPYGTIPDVNLPKNTEAWTYVEWFPALDMITSDRDYVAIRELNASYFYGNVFQILVFDLGENLIDYGTGVMLNKDGWFVTSAEVMAGGHIAGAYFNIPDVNEDFDFTVFEISDVFYTDLDEGIFIGRLKDYASEIGHYFQPLDFQTIYHEYDLVYTISFPDFDDIDVQEGIMLHDHNSLHDDDYEGVRLMIASNLVGFGSSGGLLVNDQLEVLGIIFEGLYDGLGRYDGVGLIEISNLLPLLDTLDESLLKDYALTMHPDDEAFITFFRSLEDLENVEVEYDGNKKIYIITEETEGIHNSGIEFIITEKTFIFSSGWVYFTNEISFSDGDYSLRTMAGYYDVVSRLDNFMFSLYYEWDEDTYFDVMSHQINYSENIEETLLNYSFSSSFQVEDYEPYLTYARSVFNVFFRQLSTFLYE